MHIGVASHAYFNAPPYQICSSSFEYLAPSTINLTQMAICRAAQYPQAYRAVGSASVGGCRCAKLCNSARPHWYNSAQIWAVTPLCASLEYNLVHLHVAHCIAPGAALWVCTSCKFVQTGSCYTSELSGALCLMLSDAVCCCCGCRCARCRSMQAPSHPAMQVL